MTRVNPVNQRAYLESLFASKLPPMLEPYLEMQGLTLREFLKNARQSSYTYLRVINNSGDFEDVLSIKYDLRKLGINGSLRLKVSLTEKIFPPNYAQV